MHAKTVIGSESGCISGYISPVLKSTVSCPKACHPQKNSRKFIYKPRNRYKIYKLFGWM